MSTNRSSRARRWSVLALVPAAALAFGGLGIVADAAQRGDVGTQAIRTEFRNGSPITIRDNGVASPYPSRITVSVPSRRVYDVNVRLFGLRHTNPDDIDILLRAPDGKVATIMADAGGSGDIENVDLVLDDETGTTLPDSSTLRSGTYRPANHPGGDEFPQVNDNSNVLLGTFDRINPNGTWELYVVDDSSGGEGAIVRGWEIEVYYGEAPEAVDDEYTARAGRTLRVSERDGVLANDNDGDPEPGVESELSARLRKDARKGEVRLRSDGSFTYVPDRGASGTDRFFYFVQDKDGLRDTGEVTIRITGRDRD